MSKANLLVKKFITLLEPKVHYHVHIIMNQLNPVHILKHNSRSTLILSVSLRLLYATSSRPTLRPIQPSLQEIPGGLYTRG